MKLIARQTLGIFVKNLLNHWANKKKLASELIFPLFISLIYYFYKSRDSPDTINILSIVLAFLLKIYIGLISSSTNREAITLYITEREDGFRQYQMIFGVTYRVHTLSNLFYILVYNSAFLVPFYLTLNYFHLDPVYIFNFAAFVISSNALILMLTSFFSEHKVATEVIGTIFSLASFLPLLYDPNTYDFKHYLAIFMPNSAFAIAIMTNNPDEQWKVSLTSLALTKFYMIIYYSVEFRGSVGEGLQGCWARLKGCFRRVPDAELMQQIQLETYSDESIQKGIERTVAVDLNNLVKDYGDVMALNGITTKIHKSQILGLLGRNGAGKTTLVDIITKVSRPTSGKALIATINNQPQKIGICYQKEILYEQLTVQQHLEFYARIKGVENSDDKIKEIISKMGNVEEIHKKVKQLSGGNKRKLSVSIALLGNPDLLIFDEPTSGLDPLSRRNIWAIIQDLKVLRSTVILTTHHLDEADHLSDRICVIERGKIIAQGSPAQIKDRYGRGYYLSIHENEEERGAPFDALVYHRIITESIPNAEVLEREKDALKYFIAQNTQFESLIECVSHLEQLDSIRVSLQANSLEQSFIAIISEKDQELNGERFLNGQLPPQQQSFLRHQCEPTFFKQLRAVLLKNFYCFIRQYHYIYLMNLIIIAFVLVINKFLLSKIQQATEASLPDGQKPPKQKDSMSSIFILQGYIIMCSAFISIPVQEKEDKIILLLRTRGLSVFGYWLGHFLFDFTYFMLNYVVLFVWLPDTFKSLPFELIALTGISMTLYTYVCSLIFQKRKTANSWFTIINSLFMFALMPLMIPNSPLKNTAYGRISFLKYFYPYFDLGSHLISNEKAVQAMNSLNDIGSTPEVLSPTVGFSIILFILILAFFEGKVIERVFRQKPVQSVSELVRMDSVSKKYGNTQALMNVSYQIDDERLALLGHNGAGKSTTFALLSAQLNPSEGKVYLEKELKQTHSRVMKSAGICYQDDTLWKYMRSEEIFNVFSLIVGLKNREEEKKWLFQNLQFEYSKKKFESLSGGNKRKLCMSVCLMGGPQIRLLDECSTGLDPVSRLCMVKAIKEQPAGVTVFTTHSIPEAEQLCSRSIIMKRGQVEEIGKIHSIKQKYYNCYWVHLNYHAEISFEDSAHRIFEDWGTQNYKIVGRHHRVEVPKTFIKLSQLMKYLHKVQATDRNLLDFNIDEPRLEDVYLEVSGPDLQMQEMA